MNQVPVGNAPTVANRVHTPYVFHPPVNEPRESLEESLGTTIKEPIEPEEIIKPSLLPIPVQSAELAERIEIENPSSLFRYIEPYPEDSPKQHHFRFISKEVESSLLQRLTALEVTVEERKNQKEDIHLVKNGKSMGKIHLIHFNKMDRSHPEKHYVHIYLYGFNDRVLFDNVKKTMREFFHSLSTKQVPNAAPMNAVPMNAAPMNVPVNAVPNKAPMNAAPMNAVPMNAVPMNIVPDKPPTPIQSLLPKPFTPPMVSFTKHKKKHHGTRKARKTRKTRKSKQYVKYTKRPTCKRRHKWKRVTCKRPYRKRKFDSRRRK